MQMTQSIWKRFHLAIVAVAAGAILGACGGSDDDSSSPVTPAGVCDTTEFQQVLNAAAPAVSNVRATSLTVHYKRKDGKYTGWQLHTWGAAADPGWNKGYNPVSTDSFGAIYQPTLAASSGEVGYLFHSGDTKDHSGDNQSWALVNGANEIWRIEGDTKTYTSNPDGAPAPDFNKVRVHYKRFDGQYSKFGLHFWAGSGIDTTNLTPTAGWNDATNFDAMPGYGTDAFGIYFDFPVINPKVDATQKTVTFIIHGDAGNGGDANNKDGWRDNIVAEYAKMSFDPTTQVAEIWFAQQNPQVFYAMPELRSVSTSEARAYAVDQQFLKWPLVDSDGTFKLYYSKTAQLQAGLEDTAVKGADGELTLTVDADASIPAATATRFGYLSSGVVLKIADADLAKMGELYKSQLLVVQFKEGKIQNASNIQLHGALDSLYAAKAKAEVFGAVVSSGSTAFKLWAPTAQKVALCVYDSASGKAAAPEEMTFDAATGVWSLTKGADLSGKYYKYAVDVYVRGVGIVRNFVTDPYAVSLSANSDRGYIADLNAANLKPSGWDDARPAIPAISDMSVYQLHVRDFSIADDKVATASRGKFAAFADVNSQGMAHLKVLQAAGLTNVQLLPVYDFGSVDEVNCATPAITMPTDPASQVPSDTTEANKDKDCFNWGYDPVHYGTLEGSYSTNPNDGAARIKEFRAMVKALHDAGLHVTTDMVYNHTFTSGQNRLSIMDRVVPGYYQRLTTSGAVSTGYGVSLDNTASENAMFEKLMIDTAIRFAVDYKIDSFRFDWMSDHSVGTMKRLRAAVIAAIKAKEGDAVNADNFYVYGEGWSSGASERFKADADGNAEAGQRFVAGSGLGAFNDRIRDGVRGIGPFDSGANLMTNQGFVNGRWYDANEKSTATSWDKLELFNRLNMLRSGMAGAVKDFDYPYTQIEEKTGADGKPYRTGVFTPTIMSGNDLFGGYHAYTNDPQETVNYVSVHDRQTIFDANAYLLPQATLMADRIRVQMLSMGIVALSQGTPFFHGGDDILRSKSFDSDSFNSGDWYNQIFWDYSQNNFGIGLSWETKNKGEWTTMTPILQNALVKPAKADMIKSRDLFAEALKLRYSSPLLRLKSGAEVKARFKFYNADNEASFDPTFIVQRIADDCAGCTDLDPKAKSVVVVINVDKNAKTYSNADFAGKTYALSAVHTDPVVTAGAGFNAGAFTVPARSIAVFVEAQ